MSKVAAAEPMISTGSLIESLMQIRQRFLTTSTTTTTTTRTSSSSPLSCNVPPLDPKHGLQDHRGETALPGAVLQ